MSLVPDSIAPNARQLSTLILVCLPLVLVARILAEIFIRLARRYTLTSQRLIATRGVFRRITVEIPLARVQQVVLDRTLGERLLAIGTLGVTSAGSQSIDLAWVMIDQPFARLTQIREAIGAGTSLPVRLVETPVVRLVATPEPVKRPGRILVIGLVGGIGAGKSEVAKAFRDRDWLVIDSDKQAKAALDQPIVRAELIRWWGEAILNSDGVVNRRAIADIIFKDPSQRQRLESLIHPLVKSHRSALIAKAANEGAPGVIVDAPLLIEAGSDKECDLVIFVDAPREQRLERVKATRGWDDAELARREAAQLPLDDKRRRADATVLNDSGPDVLRARVRDLISRLPALGRA